MTNPQPLATTIGQLPAGLSARARDLARLPAPGDLTALYAEADRDALAEQENDRRRFRTAAYTRRRPPEYATANYADLVAQQDPGGRVSGWLESGRPNLLLWGPSWHGKTTAGYAIANDAVSRGLWVEAWYIPELADLQGPTPRHLWDDTAHAAAAEDAARRAARCDLLLLDDLGREDSREGLLERWRARLLLIVNARAGDRRLRTIVTGNAKDKDLMPKQISERYGSPVYNRLLMDSARVWIEGKPFRARERNPFDTP